MIIEFNPINITIRVDIRITTTKISEDQNFLYVESIASHLTALHCNPDELCVNCDNLLIE